MTGRDPDVEVRAWLAGARERLALVRRVEEDEARLQARQWHEALQVAEDEDVVYGDGTAGAARLRRDPVEILADHHTSSSAGTSTAAEDVDDL